ncbi:thiamine-phosphate kinase [Marinobacter sp. M216]|uniref:Thiamine-monophosphate kinase n=1 Tax=Marinobacter albus TaxID=3030833 RepID=A0ABT7HGN4_9GAMM|nr:thiamine-phosphate kinase [Marinobacter sp. M216]MDK9559532.1 thiamine-phosphate kinase [Marinobacter sp. M216]
MGEFELIRRYFQPIADSLPSGALMLGPGDDCAIQRIPADHDLVFSIDTVVEGIHFPEAFPADHLAWRALAAAASDLAAMGAEPVCFTLALTFPAADEQWLSDFARGLADAARTFRLSLAGGDTTRGPLTLSLQVHGTVPRGTGIRRSGAQVGDLICVSGTLGDAGAALDYLDEQQPSDDAKAVLKRYHHPCPRLELGQALAGIATSAIDISDGLLADLGHVLEASGAGATIDLSTVPLSPALRRLKGDQALGFGLRAGDDYELCVTIPPSRWSSVPEAIGQHLTVIGAIEAESGLRLTGGSAKIDDAGTGFDHFRRES